MEQSGCQSPVMSDIDPPAPAVDENLTADFWALIDAVTAWRGEAVAITTHDCHSGFTMTAMNTVLSDFSVEDNRLEVRFGDRENWMAFFSDMVERVRVDEREIAVTSHAGDVLIRRQHVQTSN